MNLVRKVRDVQGEDRPFNPLQKSILRGCNILVRVIERDCDLLGVRVDFSKEETSTDLSGLSTNI